MEGKRRKKE